MKMNNLFAEIMKYEKIDDDIIVVSGIASSESLDNQNEVVKSEAMRDAIPEYLSIGGTGALREMHKKDNAAGAVFHAEVMEDGTTHIQARVVDKEACRKIEQGVYKGFSIGGKVLKKEGNIISKVKLTEISLVDRPCNPEALFSMYKLDDDGSIEKSIIEKGAYNISCLSGIIAQLKDVNMMEEWEKEIEDDDSSLPSQLRLAISNLYDILVQMAVEDSKEFNNQDEIEMSDNTKDLSKNADAETSADIAKVTPTMESPESFDSVTAEVDSAQSKQTKVPTLAELAESISSIKRGLVAAGYITEAKLIKPTEIAWGEKSEGTEDLSKVVDDLKGQLSDMSEKLAKMENSPMPAKGAVKNVEGHAVSKSEDCTGTPDKTLEKVDRSAFTNLNLGSNDLLAMDVIKSIHARTV